MNWKRYLTILLLLPFLCNITLLSAQESPQAKIISLHGRVEHLAALLKEWKIAQILQNLFMRDRVKTFIDSRTAILFIDETQVRLRGGAELTIRSEKRKDRRVSIIELAKGEGWFRKKNRATDLRIATPAATAAIRGSEINIRVDESGETVLTVLEGMVSFFNEFGSIFVYPGEEATARPGEAPTKRAILNPEDAVQWVLYYPTAFSWHDLMENDISEPVLEGFRYLRGGQPGESLELFEALLQEDAWARIGASMAYLELGAIEKARSVLQEPFPVSLEPDSLAQLASISLSIGDLEKGRSDIERALEIDPGSLRPRVLLSTVELIQNNKQGARRHAQEALSAHPGSVSANIVAGEAEQAFFDLKAALYYYNRALSIDPKEIRALVNRARIRFGSGYTAEAQRDSEKASALSPRDAQVRSLSGFIRLALGDRKGAHDDFKQAVASDPNFGEPHLGLGLLSFKQNKQEEGLWELLIATLLDPKISLYQSYLGKAYYQLLRFDEALDVLDTAKRLDPRDPSPWLYTSVIYQDLNRQVDAIDSLSTAIAMNDNRAVYRSRLLLDRDLATKNVSLAAVYRELGFESRGVYEALNSLSRDLTNSSAHLLLANLFGYLPDRLQAQTSEFLQYLLYAPVNRNSFYSFNEYAALFEQPFFSLSFWLEGGYPYYGDVQATSRSGDERFAHLAMFRFLGEEGARPDDFDRRYFGVFQSKIALKASTDLAFQISLLIDNEGANETKVKTFGEGTEHAVDITAPNDNPDPNEYLEALDVEMLLGLKSHSSVDSVFTSAFQFMSSDSLSGNPDVPEIPGVGYENELLWQAYDLQLQHVFRLFNNHQFIFGGEGYLRNISFDTEWTFNGITVDSSSDTTRDLGTAFWLWDSWQVFRFLNATVGLRYQRDVGESITSDDTYSYSGFYPLIGLTLGIGDHAVLRAAAFRRLNARLFGAKISPTTVAGFVLERNEINYTRRDEADLSLEMSWPRFFQMNHFYYRKVELPPITGSDLPEPETLGANNSFNLILTRNFSFLAENQLTYSRTDQYDEVSDQVRAGLTFTHPAGITIKAVNSVVITRYPETDIEEFKDDLYNLIDLEFSYELANKSGTLNVKVTNLLDQDFSQFTEVLLLNRTKPYRRISFIFRLTP